MVLLVGDDDVLIEETFGGTSACLDDFNHLVSHDTTYALIVFRGHQG